MGGGMPYHLEKGVTLRLAEQHLNGDRRAMGRRLAQLRSATSPDWVADVFADLWQDEGFGVRAHGAEHVLRHWFGLEQVDGEWRPGPPAPSSGGTGYWIGYRGDVERIVRTAFVWALELALGLERGADPATGQDAGPPDPIELLWTCPSPWFEAWVVRRPVDGLPAGDRPGRGRGLVSIYFLTPSHVGANVSETPLATATSALTGPDGAPLAQPVPSLEVDYEQLDTPWAHGEVMAGRRPRVPAADRRYATWVVTHADHAVLDEVVDVTTTTAATDFADWGIPRLSVYAGRGDVVVVSPSLTAGGVTHDGRVVPSEMDEFAARPGEA